MIAQVGGEQDFPAVFCRTFDIMRVFFFFKNVTALGLCRLVSDDKGSFSLGMVCLQVLALKSIS